MKALTKRDLPDLLGVPQPHPFMFCQWCGAQFSAHRGDYWSLPDSHVFECECGQGMALATKQTRFVPYRKGT